MSTRLLVATSPGEARIAALEDGVLRDFAIWRPGAPDGVGDLHRGRVLSRAPAMAGSFVALEGAEPGFLPDSAAANPPVEGEWITVRVTRAPQGGKGPRLTACVEQQGGQGLARLASGPSPLERLASRTPEAPIASDNPAWIARRVPALGSRIGRAGADDWAAIADEVEGLAAPAITFANGMAAHVAVTPALTAIDIDQAGAKAGDLFTLNRAALPELARQIRLRNLSGAILIDFAGLSPRRRRALLPPLAEALAPDPAGPRLAGLSALGFAEILRPRTSPPLAELLASPHAAGLAALRARPVPLAREARLRAHPTLIAALEADRDALADFADATGMMLRSLPDPTLPPTTWIWDDAARLPDLR